MKILYVVPLIAIVTACSSDPTTNEVKNALDSELKSLCPDASVSNVKILNILKPDSRNENQAIVSLSTEVTVHFGKEVVKRRDEDAEWLKWYLNAEEKIEEGNEEKDTYKALRKQLEALMSNWDFEDIEGVIGFNHSDSPEVKSKLLKDVIAETNEHISEAKKRYERKRNENIVAYAKASGGLIEYTTGGTLNPGDVPIYHLKRRPERLPYAPECLGGARVGSLLFELNASRLKEGLKSEIFYEGYTRTFTMKREMYKSKNGWIL